MKKLFCSLAVLGVLLFAAAPAHAWRHGRVFFSTSVFIGGPVWWGPAWAPYWYPYPYYVAPPVVIREEPPVYVQQQAPAAPAASEAPQYWYYCADAKAYYPYVQQCPAGWLKVVPEALPAQ